MKMKLTKFNSNIFIAALRIFRSPLIAIITIILPNRPIIVSNIRSTKNVYDVGIETSRFIFFLNTLFST